jgi:hypothetical protein
MVLFFNRCYSIYFLHQALPPDLSLSRSAAERCNRLAEKFWGYSQKISSEGFSSRKREKNI